MRTFIVLLVAQVIVALTPCFAQEEPKELRLDLAAANVRPDNPVFVNAMLQNTSDSQPFVVKETIEFPPDKLLFNKAELGVAADLAHAVLAVEMKDQSGAKVADKKSARRLDLSVTAQSPLPDGPLLEIESRLIDNKEGTIPLRHTAEALDEHGKKIGAIKFSDGEVVVKADVGDGPKPIMTCFFFSH